MTLDVIGTYFPDAQRDNFGKPFGQNMYNCQWFLGDRTSIISYGWFEFWNLTGSQPLNNYNVPGINPFGLNVITPGISMSPAAAGNIFIGYTVINTGPIKTSALNTSLSLLAEPEVVRHVLDVVRLRQRDLAGLDVLVHADRRRLPDLGRAVGRSAAAELHVRVPDLAAAVARTSGWARASA